MLSGEPYTYVKKIISVSIVYFPLGKGEDYLYHGKTEFYGRHTRQPLLISLDEKKALESSLIRDNIFPEYHLICLDRFNNIVNEAVDEWIYMLKNSKIKNTFQSRHIQTAGEKLQLLHMSRQEQKEYLEYLGRKAEELDTLQTAHEDGKEEGLKQGKEEGLYEATRSIAKKLKSMLTAGEIAEKTGLSIQEIERLP